MPINLDLYQNFDGSLDGRYKLGDKPDSGLATWSNNFAYAGAFRVPSATQNPDTGYELWNARAVIGLSATSGNMYMSMHPTRALGICELQIPALSTSSNLDDLNTATVVQAKASVFNTPDGNPDGNDEVLGIHAHNGEVIVMLGQEYDANADNTKSAAIIKNPSDLSSPNLQGQYEVQGHYKAAGWVSEVPAEWQTQLGYTHIIGHSDNYSITARSSLGPSAYGINLDDLTAATVSEPVQTQAFQSYPMLDGAFPTAMDSNLTKDDYDSGNPYFTVMSVASFGFIIPNTRTYAVFGTNAGNVSGIGYKVWRDGVFYDGDSLNDPTDWNHYYWFFDIDEWAAVKRGDKQPHEVVAYAHGVIDLPLGKLSGLDKQLMIRGGAFDETSGRLYLSLEKGDPGQFNSRPLVFAYDVQG